ncbi:MAG: arsenate reductase (glutaredoxin) [Bacteroidetes bacterium]|jgi:arsenate reductase|nr:arsenate reductase (glutaredoxin) [Bacteroidota bacterium]
MKIFHNPRCRKSREALAFLEEKNIDHEVVLYLQNTPTLDELKALRKALNIPAEAMLRKGEKRFKEEFKGQINSDDEWLKIMQENPVLIERPIIIDQNRAVIARPLENINQLFEKS